MDTHQPFRKVYAIVSSEDFSGFVDRLRREGVTDSDGRPDIARGFSALVKSYAQGMVMTRPKREKHGQRTGADYLTDHA